MIHAGLYYPRDSLKTQFCLRGRDLLWERTQKQPISAREVGKLIVGRGAEDAAYLARLHKHAQSLGRRAPPTHLLSGDEARALEPDLAPEISCALHSPHTGIVSAHELMAQLEMELDTLPSGETPDAQVVYGTSAVRIDPHHDGWVVQTCTHDAAHASDNDALLAQVVINASGLNAPRMLNALVGALGGKEEDQIPMYFSKGSYASYRGPGVGRVQRLLYPTPTFGAARGAHAHHSLGSTSSVG